MATEHTSTEIVDKADLDHDAGRFVAHGARRHVAFVVVEQLLRENIAPEITLTLTVRREDYVSGLRAFSARGALVAAHA